ncbi:MULTISPECIES: HD-GYP domain-containing protein [unclassified Streptomyces]|uniref:HD-GYP domain-containing protein n=1 Tax=unclassified Streptomyces TaxID=2593676 RepID=UPI00202E4696|nr:MULTISPECIES: HD-GYP domain-containing protein [unclassified Streptomyces]MCM1974925.1 HD-GYP domain-containing protein [Streptomyces sp. G1]MCX5122577.1 HD-GYP domain-containing protein [Streptomyces sp. NBC_00347]MCX5295933.1 HD-GYP domain-containing protein [Streptomyces sp. NBC_00193]
MRVLPPLARACVLCAVLAALACVAPAVTGSATPWPSIGLLSVLYLGCELVKVCPLMGRRVPEGLGSFFPVVLAAVFLLPPAAAALVALPGGFAGTVTARPAWVRRIWHGAQQSIAAWTAGQVYGLLGGPGALGTGSFGGTGPSGPEGVVGSTGPSGPAAWVADFPYVMLPAAAAAVAFCLVLTALDGCILAAAERRAATTAWRGLATRSLAPHCVHGLAGLMMAVMWRSPYGLPAALLVMLPMYISCWVFAQYHRERAAHQATIRALVQAVDIKDRYTRGHSERVGQASAMIARELGMGEERLEVVRIAGILHDVGKLGVPTRLLRKDGPLTPEERKIIELHPEYGHEMVRGIGFLGEARAAILHHHERVDGSGYPYGLTGEQIPVLARVVAVADAFDAMTSTRSYSRARPVGVALAELERCAGAQFDPDMVRALVDAIDRQGWHPKVTSDDDLQVIPAGDGQAPAAGAQGAVREAVPAGAALTGLPAQAAPGGAASQARAAGSGPLQGAAAGDPCHCVPGPAAEPGAAATEAPGPPGSPSAPAAGAKA